jgi:outer membrane protein
MRPVVMLLLAVLVLPAAASAAPLTADEAVRIALEKSPSVLQADASVLSARSGLWSAYSRVLPNVGADAVRDGSFTREASGRQAFGSLTFPSSSFDSERFTGSYGLSGQWSVFDPSAIAGLSSARAGMKGANLGHRATRADVRLETKRRFYSVVKAMHLAGVSNQALKLSRDDERRVRALFEVGSVSKSDVLKAQVRTAQSQLDSLLADHSVVTQRISLAQQLGLAEGEMGDVDTSLTAPPPITDVSTVLDEARHQRPDLLAAEANVRAAELALRSAHWARLPSLSLQGSYTPKSRSSSKLFGSSARDTATTAASETKGIYSGRVAVNLNIFDGFATDARVASARSQLVRSRETRDALVRNLEGEVRQTLLGYQEAREREALARTTVESARENLNLVQQKYNVGSATILELIDSQVQLQQAQSDLVSALADIRVAEAAVDRVRGKGE